jgi:hypothetical protein
MQLVRDEQATAFSSESRDPDGFGDGTIFQLLPSHPSTSVARLV